MGKFARSWDLFKQSGRVLMADKQLMLLPIMSSIACLLVMATFAVPLILAVDWSAAFQSSGGRGTHTHVVMQPWYPVVAFAFYFVNFFVITFFNSALIACAIRKFNGESATLKDGLSMAMSCLPQILAWESGVAVVHENHRGSLRVQLVHRIVLGRPLGQDHGRADNVAA